MNFEKTTTNKGILCILFNEQKYRFLREMASGNGVVGGVQNKNVLLE